MVAKRKNKTRLPGHTTVDRLSNAERAFLTGDDSQIEAGSWEEFFLWCLRHGERSAHQGRGFTAWELVELFGDLLPGKRQKDLAAQLENMRYRTVIHKGETKRVLRPEFRPPKRDPWVVDFPSRA